MSKPKPSDAYLQPVVSRVLIKIHIFFLSCSFFSSFFPQQRLIHPPSLPLADHFVQLVFSTSTVASIVLPPFLSRLIAVVTCCGLHACLTIADNNNNNNNNDNNVCFVLGSARVFVSSTRNTSGNGWVWRVYS